MSLRDPLMISAQPSDQNFTLHRDAWQRLVLTTADGQSYTGVEAVRACPISHPEQWVCLCDATGHEIACLKTLDGLAPAVRQILEEELSYRQFNPIIRRILSVSINAEPSQWVVETDHGETTFLLGSEEDIRELSPHRLLILDLHNIRYLIPDLRKLDSGSRRLLERYI